MEYTSESSADIVYDLVVNHSPLDSSYTELSEWQEKATNFSDVLFSATIPRPADTEKLLNEIIKQAGLIIHPNIVSQKIEFDILRATIPSEQNINESKNVAGSFKQEEQPKKGIPRFGCITTRKTHSAILMKQATTIAPWLTGLRQPI